MAITTLAGLRAGLAPPALFSKRNGVTEAAATLSSLWHIARTEVLPAAGDMPTTLLGSTVFNTTTGALPFMDPPSNNAYLAGIEYAADRAGSLILVDRLWNNLIISTTSTALQTIGGMSTLPARDAVGSTGGYMVCLAAEVYSTTGNNAVVTITASYTNHLGTAGRTATCQQFFATCQGGTFVPFNLQAGDLGVRSVENVTLGATMSIGNVGLVLYRQLAFMPGFGVAGTGFCEQQQIADALTLGFPRLYSGTAMQLITCTSSSGTVFNLSGEVRTAYG
jgi:hypothetical protein